MMRCWLLRIAAVLLLAVTFAPEPVQAHEAAVAVLTVKEVRPARFIAKWELAPTFDPRLIRLNFPSQCLWAFPELECRDPGLVGPLGIENLSSNMSAVMLHVQPMQGETQTYTLTAANPRVTLTGAGALSFDGWMELGRTYLNLGIDHILLGIDHLLFVLGLIWIVRGGWRLVKTITAFTVGHSLSLAAAAFGVIGVPEKPLNAVIALSIVFVGVEIARLRRGQAGITVRYPWAVALGFGLVHGIGFAGALVSLGIQRSLLPAALLSFNIGVEIGQLGFVLLVLALLWAHRTLTAELPRWGAALPAYAIGVPAMFWFIGRMVKLLTT